MIFRLSNTRSDRGYNKARLASILVMMASNSACAVVATMHHGYPLGLAPVLLLIPGLLWEMDLRQGRRMRRFGSFEWSCVIAGLLFLAALPFCLS